MHQVLNCLFVGEKLSAKCRHKTDKPTICSKALEWWIVLISVKIPFRMIDSWMANYFLSRNELLFTGICQNMYCICHVDACLSESVIQLDCVVLKLFKLLFSFLIIIMGLIMNIESDFKFYSFEYFPWFLLKNTLHMINFKCIVIIFSISILLIIKVIR